MLILNSANWSRGPHSPSHLAPGNPHGPGMALFCCLCPEPSNLREASLLWHRLVAQVTRLFLWVLPQFLLFGSACFFLNPLGVRLRLIVEPEARRGFCCCYLVTQSCLTLL